MDAGMSHNFERLQAHIFPLSQATDFEAARLEWVLEHVEISEEFDYCPCGHQIKEHCYIRNKETRHQTYVGNVCVNRFIGLDTTDLFNGLKRLMHNPKANANEAVIDYAQNRNYIFDNEVQFLLSTTRKRNLTEKQLKWKEKISHRILNHIIVPRRTNR
jgi:hypothetical protein